MKFQSTILIKSCNLVDKAIFYGAWNNKSKRCSQLIISKSIFRENCVTIENSKLYMHLVHNVIITYVWFLKNI